MGRKVKRYGAANLIGEHLWGAKVKAYGVKSESLWGEGEYLWGNILRFFIHKKQQANKLAALKPPKQ